MRVCHLKCASKILCFKRKITFIREKSTGIHEAVTMDGITYSQTFDTDHITSISQNKIDKTKRKSHEKIIIQLSKITISIKSEYFINKTGYFRITTKKKTVHNSKSHRKLE
jgi:hypothetical protein